MSNNAAPCAYLIAVLNASWGSIVFVYWAVSSNYSRTELCHGGWFMQKRSEPIVFTNSCTPAKGLRLMLSQHAKPKCFVWKVCSDSILRFCFSNATCVHVFLPKLLSPRLGSFNQAASIKHRKSLEALDWSHHENKFMRINAFISPSRRPHLPRILFVCRTSSRTLNNNGIIIFSPEAGNRQKRMA